MKIAQKLSLRFVLVALIPLASLGLAGVLVLQRFGDEAVDASLSNVESNERNHLTRVAADKAQIINTFLDEYFQDVEVLRNQAERICADYPRLSTSYLSDLYPDKERGGLPGYGYILPEYGAYANWDRRGYDGSVWIRRAVVERALKEPDFHGQIVGTLERIMPLTPLLMDLHGKHLDTCELAWVVADIGIANTYPNDYKHRLEINPAFNDLNESEEDYVKQFNEQNNPAHETRWLEPYLDAVKRVWMMSCLAPFYDHGQFMGTLGVDVVISTWSRWLTQFRIGESGYLFLLSSTGVPLAMPAQGIADLVTDAAHQSVLKEVLKAPEDQQWTDEMLRKMNTSLLDGASPTVAELVGQMTRQERSVKTLLLSGEQKMVAVAPVGHAGWSIGIVLPLREAQATVEPVSEGMRAAQYDLTLTLAICLVAFAVSAGLLGAWNGLRFARPINSMIAAIAEVSRGGKWREIRTGSNDELQILADSANALIRHIVDNEHFLDAMFNGVGEAILLHDGATGQILRVNEVACAMYGYPPEELLSLDIHSLSEGTPPYSQEDALYWIGLALGGETPTFEWHIRNKSGRLQWGEVSLRRVFINGMPHVLASVRNITERKQFQEALLASQEKYRELVENANSIILRLDATGNVLFANEYAVRFFGYSENELVGRSVLGIIVPLVDSDGNDLHELVRDLFQHPEDYSTNVNENICKDGRRVQVFWTNRPVYDESGRISEMLCIGSDLTERRMIEEQLRQAQKMEAVGQLAGGVAHDFNNLLQVINGYTAFLQDAIPPDYPDRWMLDEVSRAGERSAQLVRQLLTFSRRQIIKPENIALDEVTSGLLKMIGRILGEHIEISLAAEENLPFVFADRGQVEQILMNLSVNARDAMPDGGTLTIRIGRARFSEQDCLSHPWARAGEYVRIEVEDTGCGIEPTLIDRIFDPFFTTKPFGEGTGLGLATVYGIVSQHEGLLHVISEVGRGTTFQVYFPAVAGPAKAEPSHFERNDLRGTETLLVTEDDPLVRSLVAQVLRRAGYTVLLAQNGQEALDICEAHRGAEIALALLDVVMPVLGGRALSEQLQARYPRMRILFTSGYNVNAIHKDFVLEEGLEFIAKPFSPDDLLHTVRRSLDKG